jgi:hypothetical protein
MRHGSQSGSLPKRARSASVSARNLAGIVRAVGAAQAELARLAQDVRLAA